MPKLRIKHTDPAVHVADKATLLEHGIHVDEPFIGRRVSGTSKKRFFSHRAGERTSWQDNGMPMVTHIPSIGELIKEGHQIESKGGHVEMWIYDATELFFGIGIARCAPTDEFDRHYGADLATQRALLNMAERLEARAAELRGLAGV